MIAALEADGASAVAPAWLKQSWATAKRPGVARTSMRDIDAEIRLNRLEKDEAACFVRPFIATFSC